MSWALAAGGAVSQETVLVRTGDLWRYMKGREEPPEDWIELDFDDAGWLEGPTGIGYGDGDDATVLSDMRNNYISVYARRIFEIGDPSEFETLALRIDYDDGFVAYINGIEAARSPNMGTPGEPVPFDAAAGAGHEAGDPETFVIDPDLVDVGPGRNVLAIQVHNVSLGSSDLSLIPELVANPEVCPGALACGVDYARVGVVLEWTNRAQYTVIDLRRDGLLLDSLAGDIERFIDLDAPIDGGGTSHYSLIALRADGEECPPLECDVEIPEGAEYLVAPGDEWGFLRGNQRVPPDWTDPDFDDSAWERGPTSIGYGDGDDLTILDDMRGNYVSVFCRALFEVDPRAVGRLLLSVNIDDGFVAYLNGTEVGRVNMPQGPVDATTEASVTVGDAANERSAEIEIPPDLLLDGDNVLAVSVHNTNLTSSDLTFLPALVAFPPEVGMDKEFLRGDADDNGTVNLTDGVALLLWLFQSGTPPRCLDAADTDDSGETNLTDAVFLLLHLFQGGAPPPPPGIENCGSDPTPDALGKCAGSACGAAG